MKGNVYLNVDMALTSWLLLLIRLVMHFHFPSVIIY